MSMLAVRKSAWAAATARQRKLARAVGDAVYIGEPASWTNGVNEWWVSCDHRFTLRDDAYLSCFFANIANVPASYDPDAHTLEENRANAATFCQNNGLVWPVAVAEGEDPWEVVRAANSAPSWFWMGDTPPTGFAPVQEAP